MYLILIIFQMKIVFVRFGTEIKRFRKLPNTTYSDRWCFFNGRKCCSSAWDMWSCRQVCKYLISLYIPNDEYFYWHTIAVLYLPSLNKFRYNALVFIDECHATGFLGNTGRGTEEYFEMKGRVDIINSTLGKALGGAAGGYTSGNKELIDLLRQRARPYLFSNSLPPPVVACASKVKRLRNKCFALHDPKCK